MQNTENLHELLRKEDIEQANTNLLKAVRLVTSYGISRSEVIAAKLATRSSLSRALRSAARGFEIGDKGTHQKLSVADEKILEQWITEFLEQGESLFPWKIMSLDYCFYYPFLFLRQNYFWKGIP